MHMARAGPRIDRRGCMLDYVITCSFTRAPRSVPARTCAVERPVLAGAEVIANGHEHSYQRLAPQTPEEAADEEEGIRGFVLTKGIRSW